MNHKLRQLTVRGIPQDYFEEIQKEAQSLGKSINKILLRRLKVNPSPQKGACAALLKMGGSWSSEQYNDFEKATKQLRQIDQELWK
jgi:hypothetical protein